MTTPAIERGLSDEEGSMGIDALPLVKDQQIKSEN